MKKHPVLGAGVLATAENSLPVPSRFLNIADEITIGNHENKGSLRSSHKVAEHISART